MTNRPRPTGFDFDKDGAEGLEGMADAIYGEAAMALDSGSVRAPKIALEKIRPDLAQPRRAVPVQVRGLWDGDPDYIPDMLENWWLAAGEAIGTEIDLAGFLLGNIGESNFDEAAIPSVTAEFMDLVFLASSIHREGLNYPITVVGRNGGYLLETGERRLLAFHMLRLIVDAEKYAKIPAIVKDQADVWSQAAENGARRPLNAISMARQVALLIMDMYPQDRATFGRFEDVVLPGECDRKFYAQVEDGTRWKIPDGMLQRVLEVTGLKSSAQVSQYRALLKISDEMWEQGDIENWTEGAIRTKRQELSSRYERGERLTTVNDQVKKTGLWGSEGIKKAAASDSGKKEKDATLYPETPSSERFVEMARRFALDFIAKDFDSLKRQIQSRHGSGRSDHDVEVGGGTVWLHGYQGEQTEAKYSRDQVAVVLKLPGGEQLFRFNAFRLLDWWLANEGQKQTPPPAPPRRQGGEETAPVVEEGETIDVVDAQTGEVTPQKRVAVDFEQADKFLTMVQLHDGFASPEMKQIVRWLGNLTAGEIEQRVKATSLEQFRDDLILAQLNVQTWFDTKSRAIEKLLEALAKMAAGVQ